MKLLVWLFVVDIAPSAVEATGLMLEYSVAFPLEIDSSVAANPKVVVIDSAASFAVVQAVTVIVDVDLVTRLQRSVAFAVVQEFLIVATYG